MQVQIRKMLPEDLDAAMELLSIWNMAPVSRSDEIPEPERESIIIENSFVAVHNNRIVGVSSYILLSEEEAETASLAVHPDYRGKGIGYRLQVARLDEMKRRGIKRVRTETDRPETIKWYIEKFGYRVVGKNKKKHPFSLAEVDYWTVLELDLQGYEHR